MTYPTDAEVGALMPFLKTAEHASPKGRTKLCHEAAMCITALRAQLAQVQAERDHWENVAIARDAKAQEANALADRAEAERAAQIDADAGIVMTYPVPIGFTKAAIEIASQITHQPHDRTALERMLAEARSQAVREFEQSRTRRERVQLNDNGKLDEIVSCGAAHLEHMGGRSWFLSMGFADGSEHCIWFKGKITLEERREPLAMIEGGKPTP